MKNNNYTIHHIHSDYSNMYMVDSTTKVEDYVKRAKELGMTAIAFSEHGGIQGWISKKKIVESYNLKYIHGTEMYLTMSLNEKIKDNFHVGIYAKNYDGVLELNKLVSNSYNKEDGHFYYRNRITYDELLATSDNIIITTACLANFLNRWERDNNWYQQQDFLRFAQKNKDRVYLEIQPHDNDEQREYNKLLVDLSHEYDLNLIAGTDTHSLNKYEAECRTILQKAKGIEFSNEDSFDLTMKSYNELYEAFKQQGVLDDQQIIKALEMTNILSSSVSEFELDYSFKYPQIYDDPNGEFKQRVIKSFNEKIKNGILDKDLRSEYVDRIKEEFDAYRILNASAYMLFVADIYKWCDENDIGVGTRGSVTGSFLAFLVGITEIDSVKFGTVFSRFVNSDRISLPDVDMDVPPKDREKIYNYIREQMGTDNTSKIIAFGTTKDKGTIDEIVRALGLSLNLGKDIKDSFETDEDVTREKYPEVMYYFNGIRDVIVSKSEHPAGIVASPITLSDNLGVMRTTNNEIISSCDMQDIDALNYVKIDVLGLKNMAILNDTYKLANIDPLMSYDMDFSDTDVWDDIKRSSIAIFQMESSYAHESLKRINAKSLDDMTVVNAAIRPSGASYRDKLFAGEINKNPSAEIDEILKESYGFLVYQEQTIKFLQIACGFSGSESDTIRRFVSKKKIKELNEAIPSVIDGYCSNAGKDKSRETAEEEARQFIQTIQDSGTYQFNYNHSLAYSIIGFKCGYLRLHHPLEFITSVLNNAKDESDVVQGESLAKLKDIPVRPIKFGRSKGDYAFNKEEGKIFKGISSIKFLQDKIANQLFDLYNDNEFNTFVSLLVAITEDTSVNTRQLDILIKTDFFSAFGEVGKLLDIKEQFQKGAISYKKTYVEKTKGKRLHALLEYESNIGNNFESFDIIDSIKFELDMLGKPLSIDEDYPKKRFLVMSIDTRYSPKLMLYGISSGKSHKVKIYKKLYKRSKKIKAGDILVVNKSEKKPVMFKNGDGDFVKDKVKKEIVITDYNVIRYDE